MANKKYLVDIDLHQNQLLNAVVQNLATAPSTPKEGQIYYNTGTEGLYGFIGNAWVELSNIYDHPTYAALNPNLSGARVLATIESDAEGHLVSATTRTLTLADLGYTGATNANNYIHPTFTGNDLGVPLTGSEVISDVNVNNQGHVTGFAKRAITPADIGAAVINDSLTNLVNTWSSTKIQDELDAINSSVAGALVYKGGYNVSTNTPNLTSGTGILKGFTYTVTTGGTFLGESVQVGDMLIAEEDTPTTSAEWTIVNKNIPDIVDATNVDKGIIRISTQAEVDAGTSTNTAVTPATLVAYYNAQENGTRYVANIGDGTATSYDIAHGLNTKDVIVQAYEVSTGDEVGVLPRRASVTNVRILVNQALSNNQLRVVIQK